MKDKIKPLRTTKENQKFADVVNIMDDEEALAETPGRITKGSMINLL